MNYNTNIARHERTGYITIKYDWIAFTLSKTMMCLSKTSLLPIFTRTHGLVYISNRR